MFDLTKFLGFQPNIENDEFSYFDLENGYTTNTKPKGKFIKGRLKNIMILFLGTTFDKTLIFDNSLNFFFLYLLCDNIMDDIIIKKDTVRTLSDTMD